MTNGVSLIRPTDLAEDVKFREIFVDPFPQNRSIIAREFARMLATPLHQIIRLHNDHQLLLLPTCHAHCSKIFHAPLRGEERIKG